MCITKPALIHDDRLLPADPTMRAIARRLYAEVRNLPIVSPHGHTQASWFVRNEPFPDPAKLFVQPDHYVFRMLYSQGVSLEELEIGVAELKNPRRVWRFSRSTISSFAAPQHGYGSTLPSMNFSEWRNAFRPIQPIFISMPFQRSLRTPAFLPRALYERFHLEVLATTDSPLDSLSDHQAVRDSGWKARIIPTFRPDPVVDPEFTGFRENIAQLGELNDEDTGTWSGYLRALQKSRSHFKQLGCTATDHGHPTARTEDLSEQQASKLFDKVIAGCADADEQELFRAQMLTEMARMSLEDGLVMQLHPGSFRNYNRNLYERYGRDIGGDIPTATDYVHALRPLLDRFGNEKDFALILFTLDETAYSRSWLHSPDSILVSGSAHRGGFTIALKACCVFAKW